MDRRQALKRMAVGGGVAAGVSLVLSAPALADGGSAARRPTNCSAGASPVFVNVLVAGADDHFTVSVTPTASTCPAGWTGSVQVRWRARTVSGTNVKVLNNATTALLANNNVWTSYQAASVVIRVVDQTTGNTTVLSDRPSPNGVRVDAIVRRVCALGTRRAWCCTQYFRQNQFVEASSGGGVGWGTPPGTWTQSTPATNNAQCDSPAPT